MLNSEHILKKYMISLAFFAYFELQNWVLFLPCLYLLTFLDLYWWSLNLNLLLHYLLCLTFVFLFYLLTRYHLVIQIRLNRKLRNKLTIWTCPITVSALHKQLLYLILQPLINPTKTAPSSFWFHTTQGACHCINLRPTLYAILTKYMPFLS